MIRSIEGFADIDSGTIGCGSLVYAVKPGDGSAREQAASCQKVLGGWANIAREYATKRYRSNLINWGMLPFLIDGEPPFEKYDNIFIPYIRRAVAEKRASITAARKNKRRPDFHEKPRRLYTAARFETMMLMRRRQCIKFYHNHPFVLCDKSEYLY